MQLMSWELVAVSVLDKPDFKHNKVTVIPRESLINYATHEVVDEVFVNLPSEDMISVASFRNLKRWGLMLQLI